MNEGDRIAQLILEKIETPPVLEVEVRNAFVFSVLGYSTPSYRAWRRLYAALVALVLRADMVAYSASTEWAILLQNSCETRGWHGLVVCRCHRWTSRRVDAVCILEKCGMLAVATPTQLVLSRYTSLHVLWRPKVTEIEG